MPPTRLSELRSHAPQTTPITILDGGLATALESAGHVLNTPIWSAHKLIWNPEAIKDVHAAYYRAGADIAITASYQASTRGLTDFFQFTEGNARMLIERSVHLARDAAQLVSEEVKTAGSTETNGQRKLLVAGSVGPYGAYLANGSEYTGIYEIESGNTSTATSNEEETIKFLEDFHKPRIGALLWAGIDVLAFETLPNFLEVKALLSVLISSTSLYSVFSPKAWFTFTLKGSTHISDGTSLSQVVRFVIENAGDGLVGIGVNCVAPREVAGAIRIIREVLDEYPEESEGVDIIVYPNKGEVWDASAKTWRTGAEQATELQRSVQGWIELGATAIGGCCRMGVVDIRAIKETVNG